MEELIFKNPVTGVEKPLLKLTMLNDLQPEVIAKVLAGSYYDCEDQKISFARRSLISCFINPEKLSLFAELNIAIFYFIFENKYIPLQQFFHQDRSKTEAYIRHVQTCISSVLEMEINHFDDVCGDLLEDTEQNIELPFIRNFFNWMEPGDDEKLWLKFYQRLMAEQFKPSDMKIKVDVL